MSGFIRERTAIAVRPWTVDRERERVKLSHHERIWGWLLRVILPITLGLCVQLLVWMWVSTPYPIDAWSFSGGAMLIFVILLLAIWTWHSWLPFDREVFSKPGNFPLRHLAFALVALAIVGGFALLNTGDDPPEAKARITFRA